jgi:glutathione S-transferase
MMTLYNSAVSGNCYKARLLMAHLGIDYECVEIDVIHRAVRPPALDRNPARRVPLLVLEDGRAISESNAILWHLAKGTDYLPADTFEEVQVLQWLFFEQNLHEPNIAVARYWVSIVKQPDKYEHPLKLRRAGGEAALQAMERHLEDNDFFAAGRYTIADIALYGYTHVADEGGFDLTAYPAIGAWLDRVRQQPGHVPMLPR